MTIINALPDPQTGTITLDVADVTGATGILRVDANGPRLVRLRQGNLPATGHRVFIDYEPALSGQINYRMQGTSGEVWTSLEGVELPRLILPSIPAFSVTVENVHGYSATRETRSQFHQIIGRNDPLVAEGRLAPRTGSLDMWCASYADARDLENMLERGQSVMYRQVEHPGMDMYFHAVRVGITPDEGAWRVSVDYVEIDFPPGYVLAANNWTFDKLAATGGSFDAVSQAYRSFYDLTIGEQGTE